MQANLKRMVGSVERLSAAVDSMHQNNVSCRRNLMVFRARMDAAEGKVAAMQDALTRALDLLADAEADARRAASFRDRTPDPEICEDNKKEGAGMGPAPQV